MRMPIQEIKELIMPTKVEAFFSSEVAECLAGLLGSVPHNPFNFQDKLFKLMLIDAKSNPGKQQMEHMPEHYLKTARETAIREPA